MDVDENRSQIEDATQRTCFASASGYHERYLVSFTTDGTSDALVVVCALCGDARLDDFTISARLNGALRETELQNATGRDIYVRLNGVGFRMSAQPLPPEQSLTLNIPAAPTRG